MLSVWKRTGQREADRIQEVRTAWGLLDHQVVHQVTTLGNELGANTAVHPRLKRRARPSAVAGSIPTEP